LIHLGNLLTGIIDQVEGEGDPLVKGMVRSPRQPNWEHCPLLDLDDSSPLRSAGEQASGH
jgi:hypothetical protein